MSEDLLIALRDRVEEDLDGISLVDDRLEAIIDARFGEVTLQIEHDDEAGSLRVMVCLPPPAGAGPDFLLWALSMNTQYWDVKIGLDDGGQLVVHADLEADGQELAELTDLASLVIDRGETIVELLDSDLVDWLLEHHLGTPTQRDRWHHRRPAVEEADEL